MSGQPIRIGAENQYILFYNDNCLNSKEFLNILVKNQELYKKFKKIYTTKDGPKLPFLRVVPTIVVPNVNKPLEGSNVFKWLEQQSQKRQNEQTEEITPYLPGEMSDFGGNAYSYLGMDDRSQPMENNFTFLNKGFQKIDTPAEESFATTQPKRLKDLNTSNREQFPQINQGRQMQSATNSLPPPVSSENDGKTEDAYNNLVSRRQADNPPQKEG